MADLTIPPGRVYVPKIEQTEDGDVITHIGDLRTPTPEEQENLRAIQSEYEDAMLDALMAYNDKRRDIEREYAAQLAAWRQERG